MASLRIFTRLKLSSILQSYSHPEFQKTTSPIVLEIQKRWGTFRAAPRYKDATKYTDFEITNDSKEWQYVERLLPYKTIPIPRATGITASGWKPQNVLEDNLPYFISRTKNHMQPVFLQLSKRAMRKLTYVTKIQGDIWQFETDMKQHIEAKARKRVGTRVNELAGLIIFRGDHVSAAKEWLDTKGF